MKWLRTIVIFDKGNIIQDLDWKEFHSSYTDAIKMIVHPAGSGKLTVRRRKKLPNGKFRRNGVQFLRKSFLDEMISLGWSPESQVDMEYNAIEADLISYPDCSVYKEEITSKFGGFDFVTHTDDLRVAVEWETGNISSSHRSLNKLCIALNSGIVDIGVLIVPSRDLYRHLTDRIGNIGELSPYLSMWNIWGKEVVSRGLLAVTVVEHDELTDGEEVPFFATGTDGRHRQGQGDLLSDE